MPSWPGGSGFGGGLRQWCPGWHPFTLRPWPIDHALQLGNEVEQLATRVSIQLAAVDPFVVHEAQQPVQLLVKLAERRSKLGHLVHVEASELVRGVFGRVARRAKSSQIHPGCMGQVFRRAPTMQSTDKLGEQDRRAESAGRLGT